MTTFKNETFRNQEVVVDGNEYIDCNFVNCTLIHRGTASPDFIRCSFTSGRVQLEGDASRTTRYLSSLYAAGAGDSVEGVLKRMNKGLLPFTQRPAPCDPVATGNNNGRLAMYSAVMVAVTLFILFFFSWAGLTEPRNALDETSPAAPLRSQIPLELMPSLPAELAAEYDALRDGQLDELTSFDWVDQEAGTARIPIENAFTLLIEQQAASTAADAQEDDE